MSLLSGISGSTGVTFTTVNNTISSALQTQETRFKATLSSMQTDADGNISQIDLLRMQQQMAQWSLLIETQSTVIKQIADALKAVIQKSS